MPFERSAPLTNIHDAIRSALHNRGFKVLRADEYTYSENLFTNIEVFMHGCKFAISVFERSRSDQHNPNVNLEVGYILGLNKRVCILKDKTIPLLNVDLQGRLYVEFDIYDPEQTIRDGLVTWLRSRRLNLEEHSH